MTEDMLLILAMSTDAFFAALSYSAGRIRIPAVSALIICAVSTIVLTLSAGLSSVLGSFIPDEACRISGAVLLGFIGIVGFFQNGLKSILRRHQGKGKLSFCCFDIDFVISVYLDETQADSDMSKVLSPRESLALAAALSVDSVSGGAFRYTYNKTLHTEFCFWNNCRFSRSAARGRSEKLQKGLFLDIGCVSDCACVL